MTDTATLPTTPTSTTTVNAATDSQVLSILSLISALSGILFGLVFPLSIVAIVLGILALSREPRGRTMAIWGIVVGAVPGASPASTDAICSSTLWILDAGTA